jgi:hypothetical protein
MTFRVWVTSIFPIGFFTAITYAAGRGLHSFTFQLNLSRV